MVSQPGPTYLSSASLVVEVKSGKSLSPTREHLRQLDDWVFDLSGESRARYWSNSPINVPDFSSSAFRHERPHKGVLIYNGPVTEPFDDRPAEWLSHNELQFALLHDFCIASFQTLLEWRSAHAASRPVARWFWRALHGTSGVLPSPDDPNLRDRAGLGFFTQEPQLPS